GALGAGVTTVVDGAVVTVAADVTPTTRSRFRPLKGIGLTDAIVTYPPGRTLSTATWRPSWNTCMSGVNAMGRRPSSTSTFSTESMSVTRPLTSYGTLLGSAGTYTPFWYVTT